VDAADGRPDYLDCGGGRGDVAVADPSDRVRRCETVVR
jgi:hypothetical protein